MTTTTHPEEARAARLAAIRARRDAPERLAAIDAIVAARAVAVTTPAPHTTNITTHDPVDRPTVLRWGRTPEGDQYALVWQVGDATVGTLVYNRHVYDHGLRAGLVHPGDGSTYAVTDANGATRATHIVVQRDENQVFDVAGEYYKTMTEAVEAVLAQ